jgi:hypothetical protein
MAQRTKELARKHKTALRFLCSENGYWASQIIAAVGMTWKDLRLILLTLGVIVAFYALFVAFGPFAPASH